LSEVNNTAVAEESVGEAGHR